MSIVEEPDVVVEEAVVDEEPERVDVFAAIEAESDHEVLVKMLHRAQDEEGGRGGPIVTALERRIQQNQEAIAWARDPADVKSRDRAALLRWLTRARAAVDQDPGLVAELEDQVAVVEDAVRAADPVDLRSQDPEQLATWLAREKSALVPDAGAVAELAAQLDVVHAAIRAAQPPSLQEQVDALAARVEALEARKP